MSRRIRKVLVLAASAALAVPAVSACSDHPGYAAVIGSDRISEGQLDDVARALCSAQSAGQQTTATQQLSGRAARQGALGVLVTGQLSRQYGASRGVEPDADKIGAALTSNAQTIAALPASRRAAFRTTLRDYAEGQLMLVEIGTSELEKQGQKNVTDQQAVDAGTKLRDAWASKHVKVSVDPRFGTFSQGQLRPTSGSLSVPVSSQAKDGAKAQPSTDWVTSLPATQKCS